LSRTAELDKKSMLSLIRFSRSVLIPDTVDHSAVFSFPLRRNSSGKKTADHRDPPHAYQRSFLLEVGSEGEVRSRMIRDSREVGRPGEVITEQDEIEQVGAESESEAGFDILQST
jgi:hypothetical protein